MGIEYDTRPKEEVILNFRDKGVASHPLFYTKHIIVASPVMEGGVTLPFGGISNSLIIHCNENGKWTSFQSDEHGFNNPKGSWGVERLKIALVGDSFTQGLCVDEGNDMYDLARELHYKPLQRYMERGSQTLGLAHMQEKIDGALSRIADKKLAKYREAQSQVTTATHILRVFTLSTLRKSLGLVYESEKRKDPKPDGTTIIEFENILRSAKEEVESWGGKFYFVYLPHVERYTEPERASRWRDNVLSIAAKLDLPIIDIHKPLASHKSPEKFYSLSMGMHMTEEGYKTVSEAVTDYLQNENSR